MSLLEQIDQDYLQAYKGRDTQTVEVLRLLKSSLKNEAIKLGGLGTALSEDQALAVLNREVKQRHDSIAQFKAGAREDLAAKEHAELTIIQHYMPKSMDEQALASLIDSVLAQTGASQKSDMGRVMAELKLKLSNPADVGRAAALVSQKLQ